MVLSGLDWLKLKRVMLSYYVKNLNIRFHGTKGGFHGIAGRAYYGT
jgi:hypothetical protein